MTNSFSLFQNLKPFIRRCGKFESGSGSGDQDGMHTEDGVDIAAKKRKTRRGKPKHRKLKPYSKQHLSYQQRVRNRAGRPTKTGRQPPAPYNTTQFLIEDHNDLPDLEQKLAGASASSEIPRYFQKPGVCRTRDSSFSVDSDEDFFYSSPEDEEEFLTKEFKTAYEDLHAERLGAMTKAQLIQEYIQLEAKVDLLTKRLKMKNLYPTEEKESESKNGTSSDVEAAKKLKIFQQKIDDLMQQNEQLRRENESLRAQRHKSVSVDSESESDSSSNENHSRGNGSQRSPGSSPVPISYQGRLDKSHRQNSSISSVDSESDSSSSNESGPTDANESPKSPIEAVNGHATTHEIKSLPT